MAGTNTKYHFVYTATSALTATLDMFWMQITSGLNANQFAGQVPSPLTWLISTNTHRMQQLVASPFPSGLAIDATEHNVYWAANGPSAGIYNINLNTMLTTQLTANVNSPQQLALCNSGASLCWADMAPGHVCSSTHTASSRTGMVGPTCVLVTECLVM